MPVADSALLAATTASVLEWLQGSYLIFKVILGFSIVIFVHELGHFLAAKWMGVRVERFAIGFFTRLFGYRRGEGITFGPRPAYKPEQLAAKGWGETDYCLNLLPFGGYVKMMGEDDIIINEQTGEMRTSDDPRAYVNKPVGRRMVIVSAGVVFNIFFAIVGFAAIYMGVFPRQVYAPVLGYVAAGSPGWEAGLLPGDRVLAIDGEPVESFLDILSARVLGEGSTVNFKVERDGQVFDKAIPLPQGSGGDLPRDLQPDSPAVIGDEADEYPTSFKPGDRITHVAGQPVGTVLDVQMATLASHGEPLTFTVERPQPHGPPQTLEISETPTLRTIDSAAQAGRSGHHLLGFQRRQVVQGLPPGKPAKRAGFQVGDVIAQWESIANPTYDEIIGTIRRGPNRELRVVVLRGDREVELTVTPSTGVSVFGGGAPIVGINFGEESNSAVVADVVPDTPAAKLGMPRGAELLAIGERPVANWLETFEALKSHAGQEVAVRYRTGHDEVTGMLRVPGSIVNALGLPPGAQIIAIDGKKSAQTDGGRVELPTLAAVRTLLRQNIGRTVTVEYAPSPSSPEVVRTSFEVRADNIDPWQLTAIFDYVRANFVRAPVLEPMPTTSNPFRALALGVRQTGEELMRVYQLLERLVKETIRERVPSTVQHISGPVGIVRLGSEYARNWGDLLWFLAFISVNLAVLNFLPLPVVDGGLMVFLLLEKLRGKPLNLKVQVITTLAGLALIVLVFVLVTFQDIVKLWRGEI